jgi:hypothetical protein
LSDITLGEGTGAPRDPRQDALLIAAAFAGDLESVARALNDGADPNAIDIATGLSPLHIAVGRDDIELCRALLERGARFFPDGFGRWPTLVAAECRVSDELADFIVEREAAAVAEQSRLA